MNPSAAIFLQAVQAKLPQPYWQTQISCFKGVYTGCDVVYWPDGKNLQEVQWFLWIPRQYQLIDYLAEVFMIRIMNVTIIVNHRWIF